MSQQLPFLSLNFASEGIFFARTTSILCQAAVYCYRYYDIRRFSTALILGAAAWSKVCSLLQWPLRFGSSWLQHRSHHWRNLGVKSAAMVKDIFGRDRFHCTNAGCKCLEPHDGGINHGWEIFERWLFKWKNHPTQCFFLNNHVWWVYCWFLEVFLHWLLLSNHSCWRSSRNLLDVIGASWRIPQTRVFKLDIALSQNGDPKTNTLKRKTSMNNWVWGFSLSFKTTSCWVSPVANCGDTLQ